MAVDDIHNAIESGKGPVSAADFLITVCEPITGRTGDVIADIDDGVDELEDALLTAESRELRRFCLPS
jgi:Mg2+ and Co2+ transporter CorA